MTKDAASIGRTAGPGGGGLQVRGTQALAQEVPFIELHFLIPDATDLRDPSRLLPAHTQGDTLRVRMPSPSVY